MNVLSINDTCATPLIALEQAGIVPESYSVILNYNLPDKVAEHQEAFLRSHFPKVIITKNPRDSPDLVIYNVPRMSSRPRQPGMMHVLEAQTLKVLQYIRESKPERYLIICPVRTPVHITKSISEYLPGGFCTKLNAADISAIHYNRYYFSNFKIKPLPKRKYVLQDFLESGWTDREKAYCITDAYQKGATLERYYRYHQRQIIFTGEPFTHTAQTALHMIKKHYAYQSTKKTIEFRKLTPSEIEVLMHIPQHFFPDLNLFYTYVLLSHCNHVGVLKHIFLQINT